MPRGIWIRTEEHRKIYSDAQKGKKRGSENGMWKGDDVTYKSLHCWIHDNLVKPNLCNICQLQKRLEAHNISGKYRRNPIDWIWVCRRCHMAIDGRLEKLIKRNKTSHGNKRGYKTTF